MILVTVELPGKEYFVTDESKMSVQLASFVCQNRLYNLQETSLEGIHPKPRTTT